MMPNGHIIKLSEDKGMMLTCRQKALAWYTRLLEEADSLGLGSANSKCLPNCADLNTEIDCAVGSYAMRTGLGNAIIAAKDTHTKIKLLRRLNKSLESRVLKVDPNEHGEKFIKNLVDGKYKGQLIKTLLGISGSSALGMLLKEYLQHRH